VVVTKQSSKGEDTNWYAPLTQILVAAISCTWAGPTARPAAFDLADLQKETTRSGSVDSDSLRMGPVWRTVLRCGNDGKLYCLHPETGSELWSVRLGERLFGCPVAIQDDVFLANESGRLFTIDLASGGILKEAALSGGVLGSPATDGKRLYLISEDGFLHCRSCSDLSEVWKIRIALFTDSHRRWRGCCLPGDQKGTAWLVRRPAARCVADRAGRLEFTAARWVGPET